MDYRSISFHESWPNPKVIRLAHALGFNDVCLQTERGLLKPIRDVGIRARRSGLFDLIRELKMSVSLWVHEFADYDDAWGKPAPDNVKLWQALSKRYDQLLTEIMPEADTLILTVVETQINATSSEILVPLVNTIKAACDRHDRGFILRSFVHHPTEFDNVVTAIAALPDDVRIMTKSVPQDWHMRSIDDPLLGMVNKKEQIVEVDIAGEYFRMDHVANCFTDVLAAQFERWKQAGCNGISVRVDRGWVPWTYQNCVQGHPNEANLWVLGYLCQGKSEDEAWRDYTVSTFGETAAFHMEAALRPTGGVVAEGLYVLDEPFGEQKDYEPNPLKKLRKGETAVAYSDDDDALCRNPFHVAWSVFRWDKKHIPTYQKIRRGHPDVIAEKERCYRDARESAKKSLAHIENVREHVGWNAYAFHRFKLEENLFHLKLLSELQLAWLKLSCRLYGLAPERDEALIKEAKEHMARVGDMVDQARQETLICEWNGRIHRLQRGHYLDISGMVKLFWNYWGEI